jgi:hypothetical protein
VNALADPQVAEYCNESFACTYLKVGTFQIVGSQKQGGNVASYFCLDDGSVVHAIAGPVNATQFLSEARWAYETRKSILTFATNLVTGEVDKKKCRDLITRAHAERYHATANTGLGGDNRYHPVPSRMPSNQSQQAQTHWLLATMPLAPIDRIYPTVWTRILGEPLSGLPVAKQ